MDLIHYLNEHFYTKQQLLDLAKVTEPELVSFQESNVMPACSYKLSLNYDSDSFFGEFNHQEYLEYYAKGYLSWLGILKITENSQDVFAIFSKRYTKAIKDLNTAGYHSADAKVNEQLAQHIEDEWGHFLAGIYGLCTQSGLPEDIAAKELAILQINELLAQKPEQQEQTDIDLDKLARAVNLLDKASSLFAPHEREKSSRRRLVDDVRREYKLESYV